MTKFVCSYGALVLLGLLLAGCGGEYVQADYWTLHTIDDAMEGADGVDLYDIDKDGDLDAVSGWEESAMVLLHENPGPAHVKNRWGRTVVNGGLDVQKIEDARFADFDEDGRIDAVVTATENRSQKVGIHWLINKDAPFDMQSWQGNWIDSPLQYLFTRITIGQIDGQGPLDIAVGSKSDSMPARLVWFQGPDKPGPGNTKPWHGREVADIEWANSLHILDINGDGRNDLLLNHKRHLAWYENPGPQRMDRDWPIHIISTTTYAHLAMCNTADQPEVLRMVVGANIATAAPGDTVAYLVAKEVDENKLWTGNWIQQSITTADPIPRHPSREDYSIKSIACGNIDNNPLPDIVMSISGYGHGVFALLNLVDSLAPQSLRLQTIAGTQQNSRRGIKHDDLRLADLDRDGDLDIITTEENGNLESWWSTRGLGLIWYENPLR